MSESGRSSEIDTEVLRDDSQGGGAVPVKLVVVEGPDEGLQVPLERVIRIGSGRGCSLMLSDGAVSREHAVISAIAGRIAVQDLGSRNGTFLGSTRISEAAVPLGALLTMGNTTLAVQPRFYMREVAPSSRRQFGTLFGESIAMREVFAILERVAATTTTVLVEGESGTGKELAARAVHAASPRRNAPYVVFDCASVPRDLAESELFGHKRGAFSGAIEDRAGAFHRADGGTICLDEIGELPLDLQPKLLRVLETGEVRRVGDDDMHKVDVRIVAATNRNLGAEVQRGNFRNDLRYRLDVVKVHMPALRDRPEDIAGLVAMLLGERLSEGDKIEGENLHRLMNYSWPGNIRELRNMLDRAVALAPQPYTFATMVFNLGPGDQRRETALSYPGVLVPLGYKEAKSQLLAGFDQAYCAALLERHGGNISRAAEAAGLSRRAVYDLMRRTTGEEPTS